MRWEDWDVTFHDRSVCKEIVKNCEKGTMIMKPQNVNCQVMEKILTSVVLPAIIAKWPPGFPKTVCIQQDNAKSHSKDTVPVIKTAIQAAVLLGFTIKLVHQLPNSPDLNASILHFLPQSNQSNIKSLPKIHMGRWKWCTGPFKLLGLIVVKMYGPPSRWSRTKYNYKLPHMGKVKYRRENGGRHPLQINCTHLDKIAVHNAQQKGYFLRPLPTKLLPTKPLPTKPLLCSLMGRN